MADDGLAWFRSSESGVAGLLPALRLQSVLAAAWAGCNQHHGRELSRNPTGLRMSHHIYVDEKPDFYAIVDDLPQR